MKLILSFSILAAASPGSQPETATAAIRTRATLVTERNVQMRLSLAKQPTMPIVPGQTTVPL